eukprot:TRINITY_DN565_c0_g1_i1.p1 TRINITY_DN565_c0_g1~~TRINITY_DN565_c0_g1_i1.p1  ORF type:complete len:273 (+),score=0.22 TRINITY_DN565_c0_g1_i1:45-821(+)
MFSDAKIITQEQYLASYYGKETNPRDAIWFGASTVSGVHQIVRIVVDPFYGSNFVNAVAMGQNLRIEPSAEAGYYQRTLIIFTLLIGVALIIGSTFQYVGKEARGPLYNFQIQTGVHPSVFWLSHYVFDVGINTILVSLLVGVGMSSTSRQLTNDLIYCAFLCFLSYVWIQYTFVLHFRNESSISQVLAGSSFIAILLMIIILMVQIFTNLWKFYWLYEYDQIEVNSWKACWVINQFIPPMQFFVNSFWVVLDGPQST